MSNLQLEHMPQVGYFLGRIGPLPDLEMKKAVISEDITAFCALTGRAQTTFFP